MEYNKSFFEKVFSNKRMERYFRLYEDEKKAINHYCSNIELAESFYPSLSIFDEVWYRIYDYQTFKKNSRENWQWIRKNTIVWLSHIHHAFQITLLVSEYKSTNYFSNRSIYRQESYYPAKEKDITDS